MQGVVAVPDQRNLSSSFIIGSNGNPSTLNTNGIVLFPLSALSRELSDILGAVA